MNATPNNVSPGEPHLQTADGAAVPLKPGDNIIGRDSSCDIQLRDFSVSKRHCVVSISEEGVLATDLGSTNHTFVNESCLRQGQSGPLLHGDRLILGRSILTFFHPRSPIAPSPQAQRSRSMTSRSPSESTIVSFDLSPSVYDAAKQPFSEAAFRELRKANERLSIFYDFGKYVGNILDIDELLTNVARRIMKLVPADSGVIFLKRIHQYEPFLYWTREGFQEAAEATFSRTTLNRAIEQKRGLFIRDIQSQPDLRAAQSIRDLRIQSTMIVPIVLENEVFGALSLSSRGAHADFDPDDFAMISGIAGQIAVTLKNAYLAKEIKRTTEEKVRLHRELEIAAYVQRNILPSDPPSLPGLDIAGSSLPAREVGGDFFDYVPLGTDSVGTTIADVSGKGLAAALLTLQSRNVIHTLARHNPSPADVLRKTNSVVHDHYTRAEMFLSAFYGVIDSAAGLLRYASAGHNPPLLLRADGTCSSLASTGGLLGISPELAVTEETIDLAADDVLALYTDGVSEVRDQTREQFGCKRLAERLRQYRDLSAHEIADRILREVTSHAGPTQFDDATLVIIKVQPQA